MIGWHIDASQQQSVIDFTSNALISFQQFWISDINFTVTLLGQFLEDMESYAEVIFCFNHNYIFSHFHRLRYLFFKGSLCTDLN